MKKNTLFVMTTGCYSDFGISAIFYAQRDFDLDALLSSWLDAHPEQKEKYHFSPYDFQDWLEKEGYVAVGNLPVVHLGEYGEAPDSPEAEAEKAATGPAAQWVPAPSVQSGTGETLK